MQLLQTPMRIGADVADAVCQERSRDATMRVCNGDRIDSDPTISCDRTPVLHIASPPTVVLSSAGGGGGAGAGAGAAFAFQQAGAACAHCACAVSARDWSHVVVSLTRRQKYNIVCDVCAQQYHTQGKV